MRSKERVTRVIFVRHGETDFPVDRIYCDDTEDPFLNSKGLAQAKRAADCLKSVGISKLYVSPAGRTRKTAEAISGFHPGVAMQVESVLAERKFGIWEGLYFEEIERGYPEGYLDWKRNQAGYVPEGGESIFDVGSRLIPFLTQVVGSNRGKVVVVVSHVGPIRVALAAALGLGLEGYRSIQVDPASVSVVDYGERQNNLILHNYRSDFWAGSVSKAGSY